MWSSGISEDAEHQLVRRLVGVKRRALARQRLETCVGSCALAIRIVVAVA
jgi:hypothetical protein